jgi:hypothetical protein
MTNPVLTEIDRQKKIEQIRTWSKNEGAMSERLAQGFELLATQGKLPSAADALDPSPVEDLLQQSFVAWCAQNGVRHCPAAPSTVATFLMDGGLDHQQALAAVSAIGKAHDRFGLPNPAATLVTRLALESKLPGEQPRWKKHELEIWQSLPADVRAVIAVRENQRGMEVRRMQGELGRVNGELTELRKQNNVQSQEQIIRSIKNAPAQNSAATG